MDFVTEVNKDMQTNDPKKMYINFKQLVSESFILIYNFCPFIFLYLFYYIFCIFLHAFSCQLYIFPISILLFNELFFIFNGFCLFSCVSLH